MPDDVGQATVPLTYGRRWCTMRLSIGELAMSRGASWAVVSVFGVAVFTLTWWVAEAVFALDRGTAQAFAGLAVALATVPAGWWFALDPSAAGGQASRADQSLMPGQEPPAPADRSRPRTTWPAVLTVAVVGIVCLAGVELWQKAGRRSDGNDPITTNQSPVAQSVAVNKSLWYEGMKITVGDVSYNPARDSVVAELRLQNLSNTSYDLFFFDVSLKVSNQFVGGILSEINPIPALSTADYHMSFQVFDLVGPLGGTTLVFGEGDEVQSLVPVGAGEVVANEPRQVLKDVTVTTRDLVLKFSSCQVGADFG